MVNKVVPVVIISLGLFFNLAFYTINIDEYFKLFDNIEYHKINYLLNVINENQQESDSTANKSTIRLNLIGYNIFRDEYVVEMSRIYGFDVNMSVALQNNYSNYELEEKKFNEVVNQMKSGINIVLIYKINNSKKYFKRIEAKKK